MSVRATWKRLNWNPFFGRNLLLSKFKCFVEMEFFFFCKFSLKNLFVAFLNSTSSSRLSPENSSFKVAAIPLCCSAAHAIAWWGPQGFSATCELVKQGARPPRLLWTTLKFGVLFQIWTEAKGEASTTQKKKKKKVTSLTHCHIFKCFISCLSGTFSNVASSLKTFS